jgi:DNA-binding MarR family transcriptional regulator
MSSIFLKRYLFGPPSSGPAAEQPAIPGRRAPAYLANRFAQIMRAVLAEVLEPQGLTGQQWGVMVAIVREPGTDQRRVAERQGIDNNSASRIIDELEELGLVRRTPSPSDRRSNLLELTRSGSNKRAKLSDSILGAQDDALSCLSTSERKILLDLLTRVVEANEHRARPGIGRRKPARKALLPANSP